MFLARRLARDAPSTSRSLPLKIPRSCIAATATRGLSARSLPISFVLLALSCFFHDRLNPSLHAHLRRNHTVITTPGCPTHIHIISYVCSSYISPFICPTLSHMSLHTLTGLSPQAISAWCARPAARSGGGGGGSAAGALSCEFCVALGHLGPPCRPKTGCHWRPGRLWTLMGRWGRSMVLGVARGLCWGCLAVTRGAGLWPASGDALDHQGSISGAFRRPNMVAYACPRFRAWGAAFGLAAYSMCVVGGLTASSTVDR